MITFHILTIFPDIFDSYFNKSILKRAQKNKLVKIKIYNLRDFTKDKHHKVDDSPYGGGPGMVLKIKPIARAIKHIESGIRNKESRRLQPVGGFSGQVGVRIILFSTRGKKFDESKAQKLAKFKHIIFICGRYEGVDERVAKYLADEEISVGDFTLSGGELPAMILVEAVSRFIPGVLGKTESLETIKGSYPVYTRPENFQKQRVPKILLSGDHKKIAKWRANLRVKSSNYLTEKASFIDKKSKIC